METAQALYSCKVQSMLFNLQKPKCHLFIQVNKYLLNVSRVPGTFLAAWDIAGNQIDKNACSIRAYIILGKVK